MTARNRTGSVPRALVAAAVVAVAGAAGGCAVGGTVERGRHVGTEWRFVEHERTDRVRFVELGAQGIALEAVRSTEGDLRQVSVYRPVIVEAPWHCVPNIGFALINYGLLTLPSWIFLAFSADTGDVDDEGKEVAIGADSRLANFAAFYVPGLPIYQTNWCALTPSGQNSVQQAIADRGVRSPAGLNFFEDVPGASFEMIDCSERVQKKWARVVETGETTLLAEPVPMLTHERVEETLPIRSARVVVNGRAVPETSLRREGARVIVPAAALPAAGTGFSLSARVEGDGYAAVGSLSVGATVAEVTR